MSYKYTVKPLVWIKANEDGLNAGCLEAQGITEVFTLHGKVKLKEDESFETTFSLFCKSYSKHSPEIRISVCTTGDLQHCIYYANKVNYKDVINSIKNHTTIHTILEANEI